MCNLGQLGDIKCVLLTCDCIDVIRVVKEKALAEVPEDLQVLEPKFFE